MELGNELRVSPMGRPLTMHYCLQVAEICSIIAEKLENENGSLLALALAYKGMVDPCMSVLWKTQSTLLNLAKIMPGDLWVIEADEELIASNHIVLKLMSKSIGTRMAVLSLNLTREIVKSDMDKYDYYSHKIRHLRIVGTFGITAKALLAMCNHQPKRALLPRLHSISIDFFCGLFSPKDRPFLLHVSLLLTDSLKKVDLTSLGRESDDSVRSFMMSVVDLCPRLTSLGFHNYFHPDWNPSSTFNIVQRAVRALPQLEVLNVAYLQMDAGLLHDLRARTPLKEWRGLFLSSQNSHTFTGVNHGDFPHLITLGIAVEDWEAVPPVFQHLQPPLASLYLDTPEKLLEKYAPLTTFQSLFSVISKFQALTELSILRFGINDSDNQEEVEDAISRLFPLHDLRTFRLRSPSIPFISDEWLRKLASAFPGLVTLELTSMENIARTDGRPRMTLEGLALAIQRCEFLEEVSITLNCFPFNHNLVDQARPSSVRGVYLLNCPIEQPESVLECLSLLLPKARSIDADWRWSGYKVQAWEDFKIMLEAR